MMKSSVPFARATATLPRNWSHGSLTSNLNALAFTETKEARKREGSNNASIILKKFFAEGGSESPVDPPFANLPFAPLSALVRASSVKENAGAPASPSDSVSTCSTHLAYTIDDDGDAPRQRKHKLHKPSIPDIKVPVTSPVRSSSLRACIPVSPARSPQRRQQLLRKQSRRQSISPAFFEPSEGGSLLRPSPSLSGRVPRLTVQALSAHDHPAAACLAAPISSLPGAGDEEGDEGDGTRIRMLRRCASFNAAVGLPSINVIKAIPECLDDHSNPSSRDPFYYVNYEGKRGEFAALGGGGGRTKGKEVRKQVSTDWSVASAGSGVGSVGSGCVTAWVVEDYT